MINEYRKNEDKMCVYQKLTKIEKQRNKEKRNDDRQRR